MCLFPNALLQFANILSKVKEARTFCWMQVGQITSNAYYNIIKTKYIRVFSTWEYSCKGVLEEYAT